MIITTKEEFVKTMADALSECPLGYVIVQCTDKLDIEKSMNNAVDMDNCWKHGLDIRVFDESGEIHFVRGSIADDFIVRKIIDLPDIDETSYFDESQFLDIDTKRSDATKGKAVATGGGIYPLPLENYDDAKIVIRNYVEYEKDTGRAYIKDWRCVRFVEGGR